VSCVTASFCVAVDNGGNAYTGTPQTAQPTRPRRRRRRRLRQTRHLRLRSTLRRHRPTSWNPRCAWVSTRFPSRVAC
jgi:hypothetical protein